MDQGIYTAAAGAIAMEERLNVISNNIANINTTGFKKDQMSFEQFQRALDTSILFSGQYRTVPIDVVPISTSIDLTPGAPVKTGNPLDVALGGDGFFVVNTDNGPRYTRAGSFQLSTDNIIITQQGYTVQGQGGDITIDPNQGQLVIDPQGKVSQDGDEISTLQVVKIPPEALVRQGNNLFSVKAGFTPEPVDAPSVVQSSLETANVEPINEMVEMIAAQRAYDVFQKVIRSVNDAYSYSMHNVGTVA
ncbi:MAG TPA: flagellar basal-body rod protein FlgF [Desulfomonilia bacterium]|nr:flagellar basal-body rod protein FlgF [Desulfomonilia bacterium]